MLAPPLGAVPGARWAAGASSFSLTLANAVSPTTTKRFKNKEREKPGSAESKRWRGPSCQDAGAEAAELRPEGRALKRSSESPTACPAPLASRCRAAAARTCAVPRCYESSSPRCTKRGLYVPKLPVNQRRIFTFSVTSHESKSRIRTRI